MEDADYQVWCSHRAVLPPKNGTTLKVSARKIIRDKRREITQLIRWKRILIFFVQEVTETVIKWSLMSRYQ
jgi:hypothetical protein